MIPTHFFKLNLIVQVNHNKSSPADNYDNFLYLSLGRLWFLFFPQTIVSTAVVLEVHLPPFCVHDLPISRFSLWVYQPSIHGRLVWWRIPVFINMWDYLVKEIIGYKEMENFCGWQGKAQLVETEEISLVLFDVVNTQLSVFCVLCSRTTCWWVLFVHHIVTYIIDLLMCA